MSYNKVMAEVITPSTVYDTQSREQLLTSVADLAQQLKHTQHELNWFKRQLFGEKSEKRFMQIPGQLGFGTEVLGDVPDEQDNRKEEKITYTRKKGPKVRPSDCVTDCGLRFDASVPMKTIRLSPHEIEGLD
ncbi:MAG: transposase, partial [Methylococcales bacterium]|nr:transposase [Methylococcales bacterium]